MYRFAHDFPASSLMHFSFHLPAKNDFQWRIWVKWKQFSRLQWHDQEVEWVCSRSWDSLTQWVCEESNTTWISPHYSHKECIYNNNQTVAHNHNLKSARSFLCATEPPLLKIKYFYAFKNKSFQELSSWVKTEEIVLYCKQTVN